MLCEYDGNDTFKKLYVYGNYIDEVLLRVNPNVGGPLRRKWYVHDHLYSPVAMLRGSTVLERYEYDAYGDCNILDAGYSRDADQKSDYGNPYYFQGKRMDLLDNGNLELMS